MLAPVSGTAPRKSKISRAVPTERTEYTSRPSASSVMPRPASTTARGSSAGSARARRLGVIAVDSDSVRTPARRSISSSDWACNASSSSGREASSTSTPEVRVAGGREALERGQPRCGVAPGELVLRRAPTAASSACAATPSSSTSSIVRSTERSARLSSSRPLALSSSNVAKAAASREREDGPSPRCRASAIAEETLWVSASVRAATRSPSARTGGGRRGSDVGAGTRTGAPSCGACSG